ncbi:MAG: hypothetical protein JNJ77_07645 [Planctomycetia bacterium]|nr:hypothetical protein [Planctomycetia bacterium]
MPSLAIPNDAASRQLAHWLQLFIDKNQVVELRALHVQGRFRPANYAGFFKYDSLPTLAQEALAITKTARGIYFTLNPVRPDLLHRKTNRLTYANTGEQATDRDVLHRRWLFIDADPIRDAHISATDDEKRHAHEVISRVRESLSNEGWPQPILSDSGNGYHLLYRIDLPVHDRGLIQATLKHLATRFDNEHVTIDQSVHNPARLCKLPGTWSRKGDASPSRPHRVASILEVPAEGMQVVSEQQLRCFAQVDEKPMQSRRAASAPLQAFVLDVDAWLADRQYPYFRKPQLDLLGRTVYVLETCPFNHDHRAPDACIMQDALGKLSAKCFHDSCSQFDWQAFKEKIGTPEKHHYHRPNKINCADVDHQAVGTNDSTPSCKLMKVAPLSLPKFPAIQGNNRQLRDVTQNAIDALIKQNNPPMLFSWSGQLTRLHHDLSAHRVEILKHDQLRGVLARCANWFEIKSRGKEEVEEDGPPPMEVVKDLASLGEWPGIPHLKSLRTTPFLDLEGRVISQPGYDAPTEYYLSLPHKMEQIVVNETPSYQDVDTAKELLLNEMLGDFPFVDAASRAHALAAILLPFVRDSIVGPTPLHYIDAPTEGTGKTLLAEIIAATITGQDAPVQPPPKDEEEWRKSITSVLLESPPMVLFDNVKYALDSPALAAALTAPVWIDRLLGSNRLAHVPVRTMWVATGNNGIVSSEINRRMVWIQLDAQDPNPAMRTGFLHPNILLWVHTERRRLMHACLTLLRYWHTQGRPIGNTAMGKYESWAGVMSGILDCLQVPGFLANVQQQRQLRIISNDEWPSFTHCWHNVHADKIVGTEHLYHLATRNNLLDSILGDGGPRSQRTRLGLALRKQANRVIDGHRILILPECDNRKRQQFQLEKLA